MSKFDLFQVSKLGAATIGDLSIFYFYRKILNEEMRGAQTMLTLCILLQCIVAVISSEGTQGSKYENPNVIRVGGFLRPTLQIPLDINIKTESESEQCQPNSRYCYLVPNQNNQQQEPAQCPLNAPDQQCSKITCNGTSEPLESFNTVFEFLISRELLEPIGQLPDGCGLIVGDSSLEFKGIVQPVDSQSECTLLNLQPSISLNASSLGHTLIFNLQITDVLEPSINP